jgi:hypothetical protein
MTRLTSGGFDLVELVGPLRRMPAPQSARLTH